MVDESRHPIPVLYGLSVLDAMNQIALAVLEDFAAQPERYGDAGEQLSSIESECKANPAIEFDLDRRTEIYEVFSGAPKALLPPLSVAEFSWRDAALAVGRCNPGPEREIARSAYARSAESLRGYLDAANRSAERAVKSLQSTFDAANRLLALPAVGALFKVDPLPMGWALDDDLGYAPATTLAALSEAFEPPPFGRLSSYEVHVLKRLSVRRRQAMQLLVDGELDVEDDSGPLVEWAQALDDFQLVSAARALRGQNAVSTDDPSRVSATDIGFLPAKVIDLISSCAAGGT